MKEQIFKSGIKKRLFGIVLALALVIGMMPAMSTAVFAATAESGWTTDENGLIEYKKSGDGLSAAIKAYVNGKWVSSNFGDYAYSQYILGSDDVKVISCEPKFILDGEAIDLVYTVKNTAAASASYSFNIWADTYVDGDDGSINAVNSTADIITMTSDTGVVFFAMMSKDSGGKFKPASLDDSSAGDDPQGYTSPAETDDSAFFAYWPSDTLGAGQTREYHMRAGLTDVDSLEDILNSLTHTHGSWDYTADGATLTAECKAVGECDLTNNKVSLTLSASSQNYSGNAVTLEQLADTTEWTDAALSLPALSVVPKSGSELTGGNAVNVGSYTASITAGGATASTEFTINKVGPSLTAPTAKDNLVYTGSAQALVNAGTDVVGGTLKYSTEETGEYSESVPSGTNAGSYSVWYKVVGDENHYDIEAAEVDVTIAKATTTTELLTYTAPTDLTYDGSAKTAFVTEKTEYTGFGTITVTYKQNDTVVSKPTNAGTYDVYVAVSEGINYSALAKTKVGTFTITPKPVTLTWSEITTVVYNGEAQTIEATIPDGAVCEGDIVNVTTNKWKNAGDNLTITASLDNENYSVSNPTNALTITPKITIDKKGGSEFEAIVAINTHNNGNFDLPEGITLAVGIYQIVTETGDKIVTSILTVENGQNLDDLKVEIPAKAVSSEVEIKATEGTPEITVGGLDGYASTLTPGEGQTITVNMTSEAVPADSEDTTQTAIKANDEAKGKNIEFFNFEIEKYVNDVQEGNVVDTGTNLITIVIPFQTIGRTGFKVLRYYEGAAEALTKLEDADPATEGSFRVDTRAGTITIYTSKFPTYAVAYSNVYYGGSSNSITCPSTVENGKVSVDKKSAYAGDTVTITVAPDKGYTLETLTVTDANGKEIELTRVNDTTYTFKMPNSKVTVDATFMEDNSMLNFFVDVPVSAYCYDAVLWAAKNGIASGVDALHFDPYGGTTRAQMVTFLWRVAGSPVVDGEMIFTDVPEDTWYTEAVRWALSEGVTKGTSETEFSPDMVVDRAQAVTFLYRYSKAPAILNMTATGPAPSSFEDVSNTAYYYNAVLWAVSEEITYGTGEGTFSPGKNCTRGEVVTFLYRYFAE